MTLNYGITRRGAFRVSVGSVALRPGKESHQAMSILIDATTRIAVQTAFEGRKPFAPFHVPVYASNAVAHVTSKGADEAGTGHWYLDSLPIFGTMGEAVTTVKANAALIYADPSLASDAVIQAIDAHLPLVILVAEEVSAEDRARIRAALADSNTVLIGPGAPELVSPDGCQIGATPSYIFARGKVGILSESGALSREVALQTTALGLGQSSVVSLDPTPLSARTFIDCLKRFLDDEETEGLVLLTDGSGQLEDAIAALLATEGPSKAVVMHIGGSPTTSAPVTVPDTIHRLEVDSRESKLATLRGTGAVIVERPARIGVAIKSMLDQRDVARRGRLAASDFITVMRRVEQEIYCTP